MEAKEEAAASPPQQQISSSFTSPCSKKSRRSVQKRVVSVPVPDADGVKSKGGGEASPPSDTWSWRKYGQKPIKGSPYPRGYYRCSSSKGCPARKQVERSRVDPTTFIVTYASDHDHSWPLSKNHHHRESPVAFTGSDESNNSKQQEGDNPLTSDTSPAAVEEEKLSDHMMPDDFSWFAEVGSPSSTSPTAESEAELFYGPILGVQEADLVVFDDCEKYSNTAGDEEEDALFAGLGELPECSLIFRRGFLERQWRGGEDRKRCGIEAEETAAAATSWCGSTR